VVETYSTTNGARLYINGTFVISTGALGYVGSQSSIGNSILLGSPAGNTNCVPASVVVGQFTGAVDEFKLYARELTATDVLALANP
jgi:hypothetical protein